MKELFELYAAFFKIGICTFGGGLSMLPMLEREIVDRLKWADTEELMDYYAIGQCTPGVIAVNTATFIGCKKRGLIGGIFATAGMVSPSIIIILIVASFLTNFAHIPAVQHAFAGIRVAVCVLVLKSLLKMIKSNIKGKVALCLGAVAMILSFALGTSPILIVACAAVIGLAEGFVLRKMNNGKGGYGA
ncbi:MAG: chromate transporter [Firmicutes bacterium]|nr:chromate transporter [Bacillota bacterium]